LAISPKKKKREEERRKSRQKTTEANRHCVLEIRIKKKRRVRDQNRKNYDRVHSQTEAEANFTFQGDAAVSKREPTTDERRRFTIVGDIGWEGKVSAIPLEKITMWTRRMYMELCKFT